MKGRVRLRTGQKLALASRTLLAAAVASAGPALAETSARRAILEKPAPVEEPLELVAQGLRYEHAEGVPRDLGRAVVLYCQAAASGHADAAYRLGWMRLNGRGIERSAAKAVGWLRFAASRGHDHAPKLLRHLTVKPEPDTALCAAPRNEDAASPRFRPTDRQIVDAVRRLAPDYGLDPDLILAMIAVESGFQARAVSPKNAQGLMQLIPETAARFGVENAFDPVQNIRGGMAYLRWLLDLFKGDIALALAGYNAGENAVLRHGGIPPYDETREYISRIRRLYGRPIQPIASLPR